MKGGERKGKEGKEEKEKWRSDRRLLHRHVCVTLHGAWCMCRVEIAVVQNQMERKSKREETDYDWRGESWSTTQKSPFVVSTAPRHVHAHTITHIVPLHGEDARCTLQRLLSLRLLRVGQAHGLADVHSVLPRCRRSWTHKEDLVHEKGIPPLPSLSPHYATCHP
jgi:hypothetical protein